jgi:uncharacterized membrane protein YhaH (DUF805 family)
MNFDFNRLYLTTDGRIGRQDFWIGLIGLIVVGIVVSLILAALFGIASFAGRLLGFIPQLALAYPGYCLFAKRFQDRDKPGAYGAIPIGVGLLITLLGLTGLTGDPASPNILGWLLNLVNLAVFVWVVIELGILRGTVGDNQYGGDPVGEPAA